ncbi:MAG: hypothetical protein RBS36_05770 [Thiomicrospira sp.]|jgi:hypothetical protein|nr:hypothetical protein [Thiomicrospira sp.]
MATKTLDISVTLAAPVIAVDLAKPVTHTINAQFALPPVLFGISVEVIDKSKVSVEGILFAGLVGEPALLAVSSGPQPDLVVQPSALSVPLLSPLGPTELYGEGHVLPSPFRNYIGFERPLVKAYLRVDEPIIVKPQFPSPRVFALFVPQSYHTRVFSVRLGDLYIGDRVVSVSGEHGEGGQTFQLTIAGAVALADELDARADTDTLDILAVWRDNRTGQIVAQSLILSGFITSISFSRGGYSRSLVVYCKGTAEPPQASVRHRAVGVEYMSVSQGSQSIRLPISLDYKPGDSVAFDEGEFVIKKLSYTIDTNSATMSVSG